MRKTYEEYVDKVAKEYGVDPAQIKAIIKQESNWNPEAIGPDTKKYGNAIGLGQLLPSTAKELGVDPTDPFQNIQGTVRYYKQMLDMFEGDDVKARAAYNWGPGNLKKFGLEKAPPETRDYLVKTALKTEDGWPTPAGKLSTEERGWPTPAGKLSVDKKEGWPEPKGKLDAGPSFGDLYKQAEANIQGTLLKGGSIIAGGLVNALPFVDKEYGDRIFEWGKEQEKEAESKYLTPEQVAQAGTLKQAGANIAAAGPLALASVVGGFPAAAALGFTMGTDTYGDYVDKGGDPSRGATIAGVQTAANMLELGLPVAKAAKGVAPMVKAAIVGGPVAGGAADAASRALAETEELGKLYPDWHDPVARLTDLGIAGVGGVASRMVENQPRANKNVDLPPKEPVVPPDYTDQTALPSAQGGDPRLGRFQANKEAGELMPMDPRFEMDENGMIINRELSDRMAREATESVTETDIMNKADAMGVGYDEAQQLIKNGYIEDPKVLGAPEPDVPIKNNLGKTLIELPKQSTVGEVAARIAYDFDLFSKKTGRKLFGERENVILDAIFEKIFQKVSDVTVKMDESIKSGHYDPMTHEISINPKAYQDLFDLKRVLAHESIHALLVRAMEASPRGSYAKAVNRLMSIADNFILKSMEEDGIIIQGMHGDKYKHGFYAFKNVHEFVAELSSPDFQYALKNIKLSKEEQQAFYMDLYGKKMPPSASGMFKNAWQAVTRMVGQLFGVRPHEFTALEALMEVTAKMSDSKSDYTIGNVKFNVLYGNILKPFSAPPPTKSTKTSTQKEAKMYFLDRRSWKEILQDVAKPIKDAVGVSVGAGLTTSSWRLDKQKASRETRQNPAFIITSWAADQLQIKANEKNARWTEASPLLKELKEALRPLGPLGESGMQKRQNQRLFGEALKIEQESHLWFNGKDMWPSTQELMRRGMTRPMIAAYQVFTKVADFEWKMLEQYSKVTGRELPPRVPGYVPHFWEGMYKVVLKDKNGVPSHVFRFKSRSEANRVMPTIEEQVKKYGLSYEYKNDKIIHEPDFNDRSMGELLNAYQEMATVLKKTGSSGHDKIWAKIAQAVDAKQRESITNEQFERLPRPVRGHELDAFANGDLKDISNKDLVDGIADRFVRVNDLLASAEAIHNIWKPILQSNYLNNDITPEAFRLVDDMIMQFTGINRNAFSSIDASFERIFAKFGGDPKMGKALGSYINGLASVFYLTNTKFIHATLVQPTETFHQLQFLDSYLYDIGHPAAGKGSVTGSFLATMAKGLHPQKLLDSFHALFDVPNLSKIKDPAIKEAIRRGAISPSQMESLFPNKGVFKFMLPAKKFEMAGRLFSYLVTRHYLESKGIKGQDVTDAAVSIVNKAMVPYDPTLGRPSKFENFGIAGNIFQTFMTYSAHKIGSLYTQAKAIKQYESKAAKAKAVQALMTGIGLQAAIAGVAGIPFVSNYDTFVEWMNDLFDTGFPTAKLGVMKLFNKENFPNDKVRGVLENMATFGSYNYLIQGAEQAFRTANNWTVDQFGRGIKVDPNAPLTSLTSSMSGVSMMMPFAVPEMAYNIAVFANTFTKEMRKDRPASREEFKKITHSMPWFVKTPAEYILKNKTIGDAYRQLVFDDVKNNPDVVTNSRNLPNDLGYERTDEDRSAILWSPGAKSVQEEKVMMVIRSILSKTRKEQLAGTEWLQLLKEDTLYNSLTPREREKVWKGIVEHYKANAPSAIKEYFQQNTPYNKFPNRFKRQPNLYEKYIEEMGELDE